ncbi:MAG: hypothetical protein AAF471_08385 [Myxococcota bacterium]
MRDRASFYESTYGDGHREGEKKGREEGYREGREEGQKKEKRQVARNMRALGLGVDVIVQATGLSRAEINELT